MIYALILAGGTGTRFWPLSRKMKPKQFLRIFSDRPMIEETVWRLSRLTDKGHIYIATNKAYHKNIRGCLNKLRVPAQNVFFEPQGKNTLAPIALFAERIFELDNQAVIVVLPSDHYVKNEARFLKILREAARLARGGSIVTLGIRPDKPETGYGYIKVKFKVHSSKFKVYEVKRFVEKPPLSKAKRLIKDKSYYWNAGIFVFRPDTLLGEIKRFAPKEHKILKKITDKRSLEKFWPHLKPISIDYAVMERTDKLLLLPAGIGWMDLGNWQALAKLAKKDRHGNILRGPCLDVGSRNIMAWSNSRLLATVGLKDIIVVSTQDAILVCAKDKTQDVRTIVQTLKQRRLNKQI
jgi:mannose-1-phosphate guanylyltransferase/mannose-6-phosphate isomerase